MQKTADFELKKSKIDKKIKKTNHRASTGKCPRTDAKK